MDRFSNDRVFVTHISPPTVSRCDGIIGRPD
jgi:hypothetical protein